MPSCSAVYTWPPRKRGELDCYICGKKWKRTSVCGARAVETSLKINERLLYSIRRLCIHYHVFSIYYYYRFIANSQAILRFNYVNSLFAKLRTRLDNKREYRISVHISRFLRSDPYNYKCTRSMGDISSVYMYMLAMLLFPSSERASIEKQKKKKFETTFATTRNTRASILSRSSLSYSADDVSARIW